MKILIMGLPGSGKTTLAEKLAEKLEKSNTPFSWYNGDQIRSFFDDWDFSEEGRIRQTKRMAGKADKDSRDGLAVICDYVCPTNSLRRQFQADKPCDLIVWMDTIESSRYEDTNKMFEPPILYDYRVTEMDADKWSDIIVQKIKSKTFEKFDNKKPTVQLLGRYQPWHPGHTALFERALAKTGQVCIMVRDCQGWNDNPFGFESVKKNIDIALQEAYTGRYSVVLVPNIVNITYGRDVGYKIEQEHLGEEIHAISATKIRKEMGL